MGLRVTSTGLWFPPQERMRSPRKSIVERKKSQEPKRELGVCYHSGTGEEVSSLDMGGGEREEMEEAQELRAWERAWSPPCACEPRKWK